MLENLQVHFYKDKQDINGITIGQIDLCFMHAVKEALAGVDVKHEIDEWDGDDSYDMRNTSCKIEDCNNSLGGRW